MRPLPDALAKKRNQYEPAFILLVGDFLRVCEFVEPTDTHLDVYSHRLYEILLRACTEFESLCREILIAHGFQKDTNWNITDFVKVAPLLDLQRQVSTALFWRPDPVNIAPFENWTPQAPSRPWYQGYNAVKHNRNAEFPHANMANVRNALSAVFIILARLDFLEYQGSRLTAFGGMWQGTNRYRDVPFALQYEFDASTLEPGEA
jgi:hypothetical protein